MRTFAEASTSGTASTIVALISCSVGGRTVSVEHTRFTLTFTGTEHGSNPTDFWIVPSTGLIVREQEAVGVTQSGAPFLLEFVVKEGHDFSRYNLAGL